MPRLILLATALLATSLCLPGSSVAQDAPTYRAGLKSISIPSPTTDLVETGTDYRVLLEPLSPTTNRLIAAFVVPADLDALRSGRSAALNRYALVEIMRRSEFTDVTPEMFKQVADAIGAQFGAEVNSSLKDQQDEINRRIKALNSKPAEVTLEKPVELGTLFSKTDAYASGMIMPVTAGGKTTKMVMGMIALRVQARMLFVYTYTEYKDEASLQWIRTTDEQWADEILKANK